MTKGNRIRKIALFVVLLLLLGLAYSFSPYKIEFLGHYDKIWSHRVNSIEKLQSASNYFDGVELDLVYNLENDILDVNHPPAASIGLNLETYLKALPKNNPPNLWLDIKNLNENNSEKILAKISSLLAAIELPNQKVLVESKRPEALTAFAKRGFSTTYYLPYHLSKKEPSKLKIVLENITKVLSQNPGLGISADYIDYELLSKHFPKSNKYLWMTDNLWKHGYSTPREILEDPTVKVLLIRFKSISGNR